MYRGAAEMGLLWFSLRVTQDPPTPLADAFRLGFQQKALSQEPAEFLTH